jgi:hypothetical protein
VIAQDLERFDAEGLISDLETGRVRRRRRLQLRSAGRMLEGKRCASCIAHSGNHPDNTSVVSYLSAIIQRPDVSNGSKRCHQSGNVGSARQNR